MNMRTRVSSLLLLLPALSLGACNGGGNASSDAGSNSLLPDPIPGALGPTRPPTLGRRIDRAGRPAISAALIGTFEDDDTNTRQVRAYNAAGLSNPMFAPTMKRSLGVFDGLDGVCGNQLAASQTVGDRYGPLTEVLLDDQLYVHSDRTGSVYLGLEAEAIKALPPGGGAAGGREPGDDVIERSYSVLAAGQLKGIDDGVPTDDVRHNPKLFPFLAPPQR